MTAPITTYLVPGFYDRALAQGRHRDIVGGRWDETGRAQMGLLQDAGLRPHHRLLDIGAGALRLGCRAVPYLEPGNYWATDASGALMRRGHAVEMAGSDRLPPDHLIEDDAFAYPGVPPTMDYALAFAVFTHLPAGYLSDGLTSARGSFPVLTRFLFTVFLAPDAAAARPFRQADGVVTHPARPPYHLTWNAVVDLAAAAGFRAVRRPTILPRGQVLVEATPIR